MYCPQCNAPVPAEQINIRQNLAHCLTCNHVYKLSEQVSSPKVLNNRVELENNNTFDYTIVPNGVTLEKGFNSIEITLSTRTYASLFLLPFSLVWSGGSLGGIYGTQFFSGEFNIFISLFGLPFLAGSVFLWKMTLQSMFGSIRLTLDEQGGTIFTGIGSLGSSKSFLWQDISNIEENTTYSRSNRNSTTEIELIGQNKITFGSMLSSSRMYYIKMTLKTLLERYKNKKSLF